MIDNAPLSGSAAGVAPERSDASPLVILATTGTRGDLLPFIALAQGLRDRGRRVLMLASGFHEAAMQASGLAYRTFGTLEQGQAVLDNPDLWDERKGFSVIWNSLVPELGALRQVIQGLPEHESCVVLSHPILIPVAALARSVRPDLRLVAAYLAPSNLCSSHDMLTAGSLPIPRWVPLAWRQALWRAIHKIWIDPAILPSLNSARARLKLPEVPGFFEHMLKAPNASVGLFPQWFASMQPDWPQPFTEGDFVSAPADAQPSLPPDLEKFLSDGDRPIVFTPGTGHRHAARYFSAAATVLSRLGRRGVFVTPYPSQVPDPLPGNVFWQAQVPFSALLPRAAAVVHHGGIGTTAESFRAGIPQLIVPFAYDQFENGRRAKRMGVADVLLAKRLSSRRMQKQLARLLVAPEVRQACDAVARRMAQKPDPAWLLDRIEAALFHSQPEAGPSPSSPLEDHVQPAMNPIDLI